MFRKKQKGYLGDVTLEKMLTMTTGLESSLFFCDWPERYTTPDWIRYFFENAKVVNKPGTSGCTVISTHI